MKVIAGKIYNTDAELAAALATDPTLRSLRDTVLQAIISRSDSPIMWRRKYLFDEVAKLQQAQRRAAERKAHNE